MRPPDEAWLTHGRISQAPHTHEEAALRARSRRSELRNTRARNARCAAQTAKQARHPTRWRRRHAISHPTRKAPPGGLRAPDALSHRQAGGTSVAECRPDGRQSREVLAQGARQALEDSALADEGASRWHLGEPRLRQRHQARGATRERPRRIRLGKCRRELIMQLLVVRHAIAFERDAKRWPDDNERPLTAEGIKKARRAAAGLKRIAQRPALVLTSPLVRARDTAVILTQAARWPEAVQCDAFAPGKSPQEMLAALRREGAGAECVAVVGHQPGLG